MKNNAIQRHENYHPADYRNLREKGYSDKEIIAIWDRDKAQGKGPQTHENTLDFCAM